MSANSASQATALSVMCTTQRALGEALQRLQQALAGADVVAIERAVADTQQRTQSCLQAQQQFSQQYAVAPVVALRRMLAPSGSPDDDTLRGLAKQLVREVNHVADVRREVSLLTNSLLHLNQGLISAVTQAATTGPTYDAHTARRPKRINTRLIDANA